MVVGVYAATDTKRYGITIFWYRFIIYAGKTQIMLVNFFEKEPHTIDENLVYSSHK